MIYRILSHKLGVYNGTITPSSQARVCKREIRFQLKLTLLFLIHQVLKVIHTDKFNGVLFSPEGTVTSDDDKNRGSDEIMMKILIERPKSLPGEQ